MKLKKNYKIQSVNEIIDFIPKDESIILDTLREIIKNKLPSYCKEKISFNVPFFYGNRGICIIWPSSIPRGGIKEGVLLGFWQGNKLIDDNNYLKKGSNKKVYYKIIKTIEDIDLISIEKLLEEAIKIDQQF